MNTLKAQMDILKQLHTREGGVTYQFLPGDGRAAVALNGAVVYVFDLDELMLSLEDADATSKLSTLFPHEGAKTTPLRASDFYRGVGKLRCLESGDVSVYVDTKFLKVFSANASFWQLGDPDPLKPVLVSEPNPFTDEDEFVGLIMPVNLKG